MKGCYSCQSVGASILFSNVQTVHAPVIFLTSVVKFLSSYALGANFLKWTVAT